MRLVTLFSYYRWNSRVHLSINASPYISPRDSSLDSKICWRFGSNKDLVWPTLATISFDETPQIGEVSLINTQLHISVDGKWLIFFGDDAVYLSINIEHSLHNSREYVEYELFLCVRRAAPRRALIGSVKRLGQYITIVRNIMQRGISSKISLRCKCIMT